MEYLGSTALINHFSSACFDQVKFYGCMGKLLYYDAKLYDHTPMDANLFSRICPKFCVQIVFEFGFKHLLKDQNDMEYHA